MSKGFNSVTLMGNLTRDPELRVTSNGTNVVQFSLAINGRNDDVSFIDCVAFGKAAETIDKYMNKGEKLLVHGRLNQRTWEQDGQKRSRVEVIAEDFNFVGGNDTSLS